jgi:hypothetical protein
VKLTAFTMAIIRRLAQNRKFQDQVAESFLFTFMGFVKNFYDIQSQAEELTLHLKLQMAFLQKEIFGTLGVLAAKEVHREQIEKDRGVYYVLVSVLLNLDKPKVVKTGLGVLINLSLSSESKELMATTPQFYQVLYQVLASYQD